MFIANHQQMQKYLLNTSTHPSRSIYIYSLLRPFIIGHFHRFPSNISYKRGTHSLPLYPTLGHAHPTFSHLATNKQPQHSPPTTSHLPPYRRKYKKSLSRITAMATINYRLIDVDALDPESAFPAELLTPPCDPIPTSEIQSLATHCRQLLQRGDQEAALVAALENVPYGGDEQGKVFDVLG